MNSNNYNREEIYTIIFEIYYSDDFSTFNGLATDFVFNFVIACGELSLIINDPLLDADKD